MKELIRILKFSIGFFLIGCASYKYPTTDFLPPPIPQCPEECVVYQNKKEAHVHWLYGVIPRHRSQIRWYDLGHWCTWALFGNDDDGLFGEGPRAHYHMEQPATFGKALRWTGRNPLHNFTHYVIGSAYCKNSEFTFFSLSDQGCDFLSYRHEATTVFPGKQGGLYLGLHGWKPFISWRLPYNSERQFDFYLGWREKGNFGMKFLPFSTPKHAPQIATQSVVKPSCSGRSHFCSKQ